MDLYTIVTAIGKTKIANATVYGTKVNFAKLKVGDSNGTYYEPTENQKDLVHTVWEGKVNDVITGGEENPNWIVALTPIPPNVGGFTIREAGIFDEEGDLLAIAKYPESYKPKMEEGSTSDLTIELIFEVSNAASVTLTIDPLAQTASKKDLADLNEKIKKKIEDINTSLNDLTKKVDNIKIPDGTTAEKGIVQLEDSVSSTATNKAATSNSVKNAYDKGVSAYNLASTANGNASSALSRANEAFQSASNGKTAIAGVLGYVSGGNTHQELANEAQYCKNIMANNLNAKGVGANGNSALRDLANLIGNISIQSLGGVRIATGTIAIPHVKYFNGNVNLGFTPNVIVIKINVDNQWYDDKGFYNNSSFPVLNTGTSYRMSNRISSDKLAVLVETDRDSGSIRYVVPITNGFYYAAQVSLGAGYYLEYTALRI